MNKDFVLGLGLGLVVGSLTLLVAPKSGREFREDIEKSFDKAKMEVSEAWQNLQADYQSSKAEVDREIALKNQQV